MLPLAVHSPNVPSPAPAESVAEIPGSVLMTRRLIWLYFWLLIFEGALRKWVLPGYSNSLLLIRDPVVIAIYIYAGIAGILPRSGYVVAILGLGAITFLGSELGGHGNLMVTLFGVRTHFLHLPLIFLIPQVFDKRELARLAKWTLISSVPMCILVLAQFQAAPDSWLNNGAGGSVNGQLESAFGKIRPPGTFSFTAGLVSYLSMVAAFALQSLMQKDAKNLPLTNVALPALAIMVGISGSRTALGSVSIILGAVAVVCIKKPAFFGRGMKVVVLIGLAYCALTSWSEFRQGVEVHQSRLEGGGGLKEGMFLRYLDDVLPIGAILDAPFFGVGLGMGTNAATSFLYGQAGFALGESDWERVIRESGPLLGLAFIGLRLAILAHLTRRSFVALQDRDDPLPLLLLAVAFPQVLNGQIGVPMLLGWAVFSAGLCLASTYAGDAILGPVPTPNLPDHKPGAARNVRGRSVYAEQLHGDAEVPHPRVTAPDPASRRD
jgi:hypothetical protein